MDAIFNFDKKPPIKCVNCGKEKGVHKAGTFHCPAGQRTRIGYIHFGLTVWEPKVRPTRAAPSTLAPHP